MPVKIESGKYIVIAHGKLNDDYSYTYPALDFLHQQFCDSNQTASAKGMRALFRRYAEDGTNKLSSDIFHEANKEEGIYEFVKGQLRIFCFKKNNELILTNGIVKKTQKADPQAVNIAIKIKKLYF